MDLREGGAVCVVCVCVGVWWGGWVGVVGCGVVGCGVVGCGVVVWGVCVGGGGTGENRRESRRRAGERWQPCGRRPPPPQQPMFLPQVLLVLGTSRKDGAVHHGRRRGCWRAGFVNTHDMQGTAAGTPTGRHAPAP